MNGTTYTNRDGDVECQRVQSEREREREATGQRGMTIFYVISLPTLLVQMAWNVVHDDSQIRMEL